MNAASQGIRPDQLEAFESDTAFEAMYGELRKLAKQKIGSERSGHTLQATALAHEAWIRVATPNARWNSREHFLAAAAEAMRRVLVDHARRKLCQKRGGGITHIRLGDECMALSVECDTLVALDDALSQLAAQDPQKARLVELRFFVGMTLEEAASALQVSKSTADRWWSYSRAWLQKAMES